MILRIAVREALDKQKTEKIYFTNNDRDVDGKGEWRKDDEGSRERNDGKAFCYFKYSSS